MVILFETIQVLSVLLLAFAVLIHSPKSEGIASIGSSAQMFKSSSGIEKGLNIFTWTVAFIFLFCSAVLGWGLIK